MPINETGYKYPLACTSAVFAIVKQAVENDQTGNDYQGVIWDLCHMSRSYAVKEWETGRLFEVIIIGCKPSLESDHNIYRFKIECGPGDDGAPVLTIMLPEED